MTTKEFYEKETGRSPYGGHRDDYVKWLEQRVQGQIDAVEAMKEMVLSEDYKEHKRKSIADAITREQNNINEFQGDTAEDEGKVSDDQPSV